MHSSKVRVRRHVESNPEPFSQVLLQHLIKEIFAFITNVVFRRELNITFKNLACNISFVIPSPQISVSKDEINDWTTYSTSNHHIQSNAHRLIVHAKRVIIAAEDFRCHLHLRPAPIFRNEGQFLRRPTRDFKSVVVRLEGPVRLKVLREAKIS